MVTAPARVDMKGSVDLAQETQNLHVQIVPTVSAGAAVIIKKFRRLRLHSALTESGKDLQRPDLSMEFTRQVRYDHSERHAESPHRPR